MKDLKMEETSGILSPKHNVFKEILYQQYLLSFASFSHLLPKMNDIEFMELAATKENRDAPWILAFSCIAQAKRAHEKNIIWMAQMVHYLGLVAVKDNHYAQFCYGYCFQEGLGMTHSDFNNALKWYRSAANQGNLEAQCVLAECYKKGTEVAVDDKKAFKFYKLAADQGHAQAQLGVAECYENGIGIAVDYKEAFKFYKLAADQGHAQAQFNVAVAYEYGEGIRNNFIEAVKYYRLAAKQGHKDAIYNLLLCLITRAGEAEFYIADFINEFSTMSDQPIRNQLYKQLEEGDWDSSEDDSLMKLFAAEHLDAKNGDKQAIVSLSEDCELTLSSSVAEYRKKIAEDVGKASQIIQLKAEIAIEQKLASEKKYSEYKIGVEKGSIRALVELAGAYQYGKGIEKDSKKASKLYKLAAEKGSAIAQFFIAERYLAKFTEELDYSEEQIYEASDWCMLAVEAGNFAAVDKMVELISLLSEDLKYCEILFYFCQRGHELGYREFTESLAQCYENGWGVAIDKKEAYCLYKSIMQDCPSEKRRLADLSGDEDEGYRSILPISIFIATPLSNPAPGDIPSLSLG